VYEAEVLPGPHIVEIACVSPEGWSISNVVLTFVAEPGHVYEIAGERVKSGFLSELKMHLGGGRGEWTAWLVDQQTGAVVAGKRPDDLPSSTSDKASDPPQR
jgi:hypothetical protein